MSLKHTYIEANSVAHTLVNYTKYLDIGLRVFEVPPAFISLHLLTDLSAVILTDSCFVSLGLCAFYG